MNRSVGKRNVYAQSDDDAIAKEPNEHVREQRTAGARYRYSLGSVRVSESIR